MRSDWILKVDENGWGRRNQAPKCPVWGIPSHILWILPWFWANPQARRWLVPRDDIKLRGQNFPGEWSTGCTSPYFSWAGCPVLWSCTPAPIALLHALLFFSSRSRTTCDFFPYILWDSISNSGLKFHQNHRGNMFKNAALHAYPALLSHNTGVHAAILILVRQSWGRNALSKNIFPK